LKNNVSSVAGNPARIERRGSTRTWCMIAGIILLAGLIAPERASAQEFLIHVNGDSINAEIKSFKRGKLSYEIPGSSSASIEFDKVATIGSPEDWDIELTEQRGLFGSILPGAEAGTVRIVTVSDTIDVALADIVAMTNVNKTLWSRFDGYLELGFNYAKANNATNFTFATEIDYRAPKWIFGFSLDSRFQDQDDAESFKRNQGTLYGNYLLPNTWYVGAMTPTWTCGSCSAPWAGATSSSRTGSNGTGW